MHYLSTDVFRDEPTQSPKKINEFWLTTLFWVENETRGLYLNKQYTQSQIHFNGDYIPAWCNST